MKCDLPTLTPGPVNENRILRPFLIFSFYFLHRAKQTLMNFSFIRCQLSLIYQNGSDFIALKSVQKMKYQMFVHPASLELTYSKHFASLQVASCFLNFCVQIVSVVCNCEGKLKTNIFHIFSKP